MVLCFSLKRGTLERWNNLWDLRCSRQWAPVTERDEDTNPAVHSARAKGSAAGGVCKELLVGHCLFCVLVLEERRRSIKIEEKEQERSDVRRKKGGRSFLGELITWGLRAEFLGVSLLEVHRVSPKLPKLWTNPLWIKRRTEGDTEKGNNHVKARLKPSNNTAIH